MKIYKSIDELIGKTPPLDITDHFRDVGIKAKLLSKLECFNSAGSVKDRVALSIPKDEQGIMAFKE